MQATAQIHGAAKVLGLTGEINAERVERAYRRAAMKYHPDRNPAGHVMMQAVNAARATLKDWQGTLDHGNAERATRYGSDLNDAIDWLIHCVGLDLEICGSWLWVSGDTRTHKDRIKSFVTDDNGKPNRFRWHSKKAKWYFAPNDFEGRRRRFRSNVDMNEIRDKYGSQHVRTQPRTAIGGAV